MYCLLYHLWRQSSIHDFVKDHNERLFPHQVEELQRLLEVVLELRVFEHLDEVRIPLHHQVHESVLRTSLQNVDDDFIGDGPSDIVANALIHGPVLELHDELRNTSNKIFF